MKVRRKVVRPRGNLKLELFRKFNHVVVGVASALLIQAGVIDAGIMGLLALLFAAIVMYNYSYEKELLCKILSLNRSDAKVPGLDLLSYLIGMWIVLLLFPPYIAQAAIMVLAFGDPLAHLVGRSFGGTKAAMSKNSYLYGTLVGTIAGALAAWIYVQFFWALAASAIAMFVEAGELRIANHHIDDNLTIPVVAGVVLWVISLGF